MASTLKLCLLFTIAMAIQLHHVDSQLSTLATGLSQIIKLLEEVTDTSASFIPNLAVLIRNQDSAGNMTNTLLQNNTDILDEMTTTMSRIEEVLKIQQMKQVNAIISSVQTHQSSVKEMAIIQSQTLDQMVSVYEMQNQQLDNISSVIPHLVSLLEKQQNMHTLVNLLLENSAVTQIVATQTRMAESLDQIVDLLQIKNQPSESVSPQQRNTANPQVQQWTTLSPTSVIVETTNAPITQPPSIPLDCSDISAADNQGSGVYTIDPRDGLGSFQVYCNMDIDGGGWTVFQKRFDGSVDFFIGWRDYKDGFGNVQGEHWMGLQQLHRLTSIGRWKLRIDMEDFNGNSGYAQYEDFQIGDAASFYQLSIGAYSGTAGYDALAYHNGHPFSTKDSDHDTYASQFYDASCALHYQGAWWYTNCHNSNLNGLYKGSTSPVPNDPSYSLMCWYSFSGSGNTPIQKSEMKLRRVQ